MIYERIYFLKEIILIKETSNDVVKEQSVDLEIMTSVKEICG